MNSIFKIDLVKFVEWLEKATIRAVKTMAQTAIGCFGSAMVITDVNWKYAVSAALLAGLASYLTSIGGLPELEDKSTSDSDYDLVIEDDEEELLEVTEELSEEE